MQSIYSMHQSNSDAIEKEEKFLFNSIENINNLYLTILSALVEIQKLEVDFIEKSKRKHLATPEELNPNTKFIDNKVFQVLAESNSLSMALEDKKIRSEEHTSELQSREKLVCRLLFEKKNKEVIKLRKLIDCL